MNLSEHFLKHYALMAQAMEKMALSRRAQIKYHLLADALYWTDETPPDLESLSENSLRPVLRYRTTLILGEPEDKWRRFWDEAKLQFPNWIGFVHNRCQPHTKLGEIYRQYSKEGDSQIQRLYDDAK